jgi:hypothetical protein
MKKINLILSLIVIAFTVSCDSDPDNIMAIADEGGVVMNTSQSSGSILGTPSAGISLEDADVDFATVFLDFDARVNLGSGEGVAKYEIVKTLNGGEEVSVVETESLPFNLEYTTIEEYVDGFGIAPTDLRIGDIFTFTVKIIQNDGDVYYYNSKEGQYSVVVNCSSSLAGFYQVTSVRDDGSVRDHGIEEIYEVSPGYYRTTTTGLWTLGNLGAAPAEQQGYNFNDTCNTITVPAQALAQGFYSNSVVGTDDGEVLANGDIVINYEISFSAGNSTYTNTYVKQ